MASYKTVANQTLSDKIMIAKLKQYFTVTLRDLEIHFGFEFYLVACLIHLPFPIFHVITNSCITSHKNHLVVRRKMKLED